MDPNDVGAFSAAIAPVIDRLRLGIMERMVPQLVPMMVRVGIGEPGGRTLGMLRNVEPGEAFPASSVEAVVEPGEAFPASSVEAVFRYVPREQVAAGVAELTGAGLVEPVEPAALVVTPAGLEVLAELHGVSATITAERWPDGPPLAALDALAARAVEAARPSGGPAFALVTPARDDPEAAPSALLGERLTALRFHRFDAHVAAWTAAGLTALEVAQLPPGDARDEIEAATNRHAADAYRGLTTEERLDLLAGLAALRN
jgi:hypothetical protein